MKSQTGSLGCRKRSLLGSAAVALSMVALAFAATPVLAQSKVSAQATQTLAQNEVPAPAPRQAPATSRPNILFIMTLQALIATPLPKAWDDQRRLFANFA